MNSAHYREQGAALVVTLIVCTVLAMVVVALMQNTGLDRASSVSVGNQYRAQLAAEAGAVAAESLVSDLVRRYPDSATVWQNIGGGTGGAAGTNNEATVLYMRAQSANTNLGARPGQFGSEITLLAMPLVSRVDAANSTLLNRSPMPLNLISSTLPFATDNTNMVNLNATNSSRPHPFVGLRSATNPGAPVTAAQWIYLGAQPGPTNASNPAIARYAFWVEDESFKVNVNVATNGLRGASSLGLSPAELRLDGAWGTSTNVALRGANAGTVVTARNGLPGSVFPTALTAALPAGLTDINAADELKFLTTSHSAGLDLSRGGFKRFNINTVTNGIAGPTDAANIRTSLNRVIAAITNSNSVPNFGQRFYRLANTAAAGTNPANINALAVTPNHAAIYLNKIAVNILDYTDADDQPTIVNIPTNTTVFNNMSDFTIRVGRPEFGIEPLGGGTEGTNSVAAMGVENTPRLQEYVIHGRLRDLEPIGFNSSSPPPDPVANYRITIDHYFEFWNPGTRDITLSGAFLRVYDQPRYGTNITGVLTNEGRPFELPLNLGFVLRGGAWEPVEEITFPAGRTTVLTTAPTNEINSQLIGTNIINLVSVPGSDDSHREFTGQTRDTNATGAPFRDNGLNRYFHVSMRARSTPTTDYESGVLLGNDLGLLESFGALPIANQTGPSVSALHFIANTEETFDAMGDDPAVGNLHNVRGGSLVGNSSITNTPSWATGDPRSLNEQLEVFTHTSDTNALSQVTRFATVLLANGSVPANSSLGAPNANYINTARWLDFSSLLAGANNAPLFVRNDSMQSVGEIGHITDPARVPGPPAAGALSNVVYSRGGGRTLRVGQSEHSWWFDRNQTSASRTWTSWRLADVFTTKTDVSIAGLINPNGFLRDRGAAWRATLHGLNYLPAPEGVGLPALNDFRINAMINAMAARMTNTAAAGLPAGSLNAFWERGEISELPIFNTGNIPANMTTTFDRGREELVRRSIEMITTRGSVFTVYSIGQTLQGTNVTGVARMKQTFQIEPVFQDPAGAFNDAFAVDSDGIQRRFAPPINYTLRVLATSYD
jgi:hypothetical protein